ncbi:CRISPR-associated protein Cas4 [Bacillus pseudomycoides]|uniref:CRISPR-associated protein Cas4 n=1 Tax=Bacillus pseudomycoides TaxID=64104 RepID=UPI000BF0B782|nr:CRISPR-associated protein Cas4 [Bacillus pseudomycoides]PEJ36422.1 CRISPR-associated protein Cas4 [Bacillus pseudomycoides]
MDITQLKAKGLHVQYYYVCKRKLWLHAHDIQFEQDNDKVLQGKILHDRTYPRMKQKEVLIDNLICIDIYDDYVGEVKSSSKMKQADTMQLLYYLYVLKQLGIEKNGKLHYPKEKKVEEIEITEISEKQIKEVLVSIQSIISMVNVPKAVKLPYCSKCAYYSFCWVGEEE